MIYEYECPTCGTIKEGRNMSVKDTTVFIMCNKCKRMRRMKRIISKSNFILKGKGWAEDGYATTEHGAG